MRFPYQPYEVQPSAGFPAGLLFRPEASLRVSAGKGGVQLHALVDTGSNLTLLPRSVGDAIGADFDAHAPSQVTGVAGATVEVLPARVNLVLQDTKHTYDWIATVGFVSFRGPENEVALLGHSGFLDRFIATFDGQHRVLTLKPTPAFRGFFS